MALCENYFNDRTDGGIQMERIFKSLKIINDYRQLLTRHTGLNYTKSNQAWMLYHHFAAQVFEIKIFYNNYYIKHIQ